jgi:hypothetical protein
MDQYLHDENGRRLSPRERLDRLRKPFADQTVVDAAPVAAQSLAERQAARKAQDELGREIAAEVRRLADEAKPATNPYVARIVEIERMMEYADPSQRQSLGGRLTALKKAAAGWEAEKAAAERKAAFDANPSIRLMRENAEALRQSPQACYPDVRRESIDLCLAIANAQFDSPEIQASKYWAAVRELEEQQRAAEAAKFQQETDTSAQQSANYQAQKQRLADADARVVHAQKMGGGSDAAE